MLKPSSLIAPVVALVVAGVWIGSQRQSISTLENESALLQKHIAAAHSCLGAMPEDQREDVLSNWSFQQLKEEIQLAFAKLVRDQVPEKDQAQTLAQQASRMVGNDEGYSNVTEYMDRIAATPAERAACVQEAAESKIRSLAQNDGWAARQNKDQARVLAEKISEPKRRGEIVEKLK